jgi:RNA polymerase sigma factor (sigma-70 family)
MADLSLYFHQYGKKIYNLAYRMTGNKEDADDITQETFIQAAKSINSFRHESNSYTWLYQIAKNNCLRFLEKKNRTTFLTLRTLSEQVSSPVADDISEYDKYHYILQVKEGCLLGMLRCLPIQQRLVFILNILLDLPLNEVALVIEKSENATRILVHRARQSIRNYLCENCSLYNIHNSCRCENLINFSLNKEWIRKEVEENNPIYLAEEEIREIRDEIKLFKTLPEKNPDMSFVTAIQQLISEKEDLLIFRAQKVK